MPRVRPADEHHPVLTAIDDATDEMALSWACGWLVLLTDEEAWGEDETWRRIPARHADLQTRGVAQPD